MTSSDASSIRLQASLAMYDLAMGETVAEEAGMTPASPDEAGMMIAGRYVLKSRLGEGSSGVVWRAQQTAPVKREVAMKIIHPGLGGWTVTARFGREHQMLARMEHPNIAAVFDAGELPDGRAFFAMELVDGMPVTCWCVAHQTDLRPRLEIFLQACQAVQHAHQRGILHRDLKPSNVLVTMAGGKPLVKVIDFGIAKALCPDLSPGEDATLHGTVLGTPRYMSPEQAGLTGQDVDTRTDVFALGVLLYELLTGTTPIPDDDEKAAGLPELLQRVRHTETERPSRRVTRGMAPARAPLAEPRRLARLLSGDLDWILLRALHHDREQRYPGVSALAEDVQRHLRDEPVSAGPPGAGYRLKKWGRRRRGTLVAAAAVLSVFAAGVSATWWALDGERKQRIEAERHERRALREARLAGQIHAQLGELLLSARRHVEAGLNTAILRQIADECAAGMERFADSPRTAAPLAKRLADLYDALQERLPAMQWYKRHWELLRQTEGPRSPATLDALYELGWRAVDNSMGNRAVEWLQEAADGLEQVPGAEDGALVARKEQARALSRAARHEDAVRLFAEVMARTPDTHPKYAVWLREQSDALRAAARPDEAMAAIEKAMRHLPPGDAGPRAYVLAGLASLQEARQRWEAALEASGQYLTALEARDAVPHSKLLNALIQHAQLACKCPGCPGGEAAARRALALAETSGTQLAEAWTTWCEVLRVTRRFHESEAAARQAIEELSSARVEPWCVCELHRRLGDLLTERAEHEEALHEYHAAAEGLFEQVPGRPRDKEELIYSSFVAFWERVQKAGSPMADERKLAEWNSNYAAWKLRQKSLP